MKTFLVAFHVVLLLVLALAGPDRPTTLPATPPDGLDASFWERMQRVDAKAAGLHDLTADFAQQKFTALLKKPMESSGNLRAKGPVMLWETQSPQATFMRVDDKEIQLYYPAQKTVEIYPIDGPLSALVASPIPRLASLLGHFTFAPASPQEMGAKDAPGFLAVRLTPTDPAIRQHVQSVSVLLDVEHGWIVGFSLIDADGDRTQMRFSNINANTNLDDARLALKLPPDVKTVRPLGEAGAPSKSETHSQ